MNINESCGELMPPIRLRNTEGCTAENMAANIQAIAQQRGVPANTNVQTIRSGNFLFGSDYPCVIVSHPNPPQPYFSHMIVINGSVISFHYWGRSKANENRNKKEALKGTFRGMFVSDDSLALQTEDAWHSEMQEIYESLFA